MSRRSHGCGCSACRETDRFEARWRLLEVLGNVCGVDGFEIMFGWCRKNANRNAMYVAHNDEPFFVVCSLIVSAGRQR